MNRWPRRPLVMLIVALVLWGVSMPFAFVADGGWRIAGFVVFVSSMISSFVLIVRQQMRQSEADSDT